MTSDDHRDVENSVWILEPVHINTCHILQDRVANIESQSRTLVLHSDQLFMHLLPSYHTKENFSKHF